MPPLNSVYEKRVAKSDNYAITIGDDVITFTIASAKTATLPQAETNRQLRELIRHADDCRAFGQHARRGWFACCGTDRLRCQ